MLFNPKWGQTLEGFIAWLETKDPAECYDYRDITECAVAQWLKSLGYTEFHDFTIMPSQFERRVGFPEQVVNSIDQTFGGALCRARELLAKRMS